MHKKLALATGAVSVLLSITAHAATTERDNLSFAPLKASDQYEMIDTPNRLTAHLDNFSDSERWAQRHALAKYFWGLASDEEREENKHRFVGDMIEECAKITDAFDKGDGFYPALSDASKKAHTEPKECSCRSEGSTAPSSSVKQWC